MKRPRYKDVGNNRICSTCGREHPRTIEFFRYTTRNREPFSGQCRACISAGNLSWQRAHVDKVKARKRELYRLNPEPIRARNTNFRAQHRDRQRARDRRYYELRRNELRARDRQKSATLAGRIARWSERLRAIDAPADQAALEYAGTLLNDQCAYCGGPGGTIDHIVPIAHGGGSEITNLTSACVDCNRSKGKLTLLMFLSRGPTWRIHPDLRAEYERTGVIMRTCTGCQTTLPLTLDCFRVRSNGAGGGYYRQCLLCLRAQRQRNYRDRRDERLTARVTE